MKKILSIIIVFLLTSVSLFSNIVAEEPTSRNIIYVDDDGGVDYTRIQDAIDNANYGDTVFVYSGVYRENVVVDKSITLKGEDRYTTIIDGGENGYVIYVKADGVNISGFTVKNNSSEWEDTGIFIQSNNNTYTNNIIRNNGGQGIYLIGDSITNNTISNNIIINNSENGIWTYHTY